jgi:hypothetical protein
MKGEWWHLQKYPNLYQQVSTANIVHKMVLVSPKHCPMGDITRQSLDWNPKTWRRSLKRRIAKVHTRWRKTVEAICSTRSEDG